jgi:hypothetical protein
VLGEHLFDVDIGNDRTVLLQEADVDLVGSRRRVDRAQLLTGDQVDRVADGRIVGDAALEFRLVAGVEDLAEQVDRGNGDVTVGAPEIIEPAQRMLTKRPTVARTSEIGIRLSVKSPTRACDPRTEITRPKDVTMNEPGKSNGFGLDYARSSLDKRLNARRRRFVKSATIRPGNLFQMHTCRENRPESAAFPGNRPGSA